MTFSNCSGFHGGVLYLDSNLLLKISNCLMENSTADDFPNNELEQLSRNYKYKSGGAIYFSCSKQDKMNCSLEINSTNFTDNTAAYAGGAIHWEHFEPTISSNCIFDSNKVILLFIQL